MESLFCWYRASYEVILEDESDGQKLESVVLAGPGILVPLLWGGWCVLSEESWAPLPPCEFIDGGLWLRTLCVCVG